MNAKTKTKLFFILIVCLLAIIFLMLLTPFALKKFSKFLVYEKPCAKADILIVLSGGDGDRVEKAAELYHAKVAPKMLMNGGGKYFGRYYSEYMRDYAQSLGVRKRDILEERNSLSTFENAVQAYPIIKNLNVTDILIVTSKFHTKRSYKIFTKVFAQDKNIKLYIIGSDDKIDYDRWWKDYEMSEQILIEWAKMLLYWIKY